MTMQNLKLCALAGALAFAGGAYAQTAGTPTTSTPHATPATPTPTPMPNEPVNPNTPAINPQAGTTTLPETPPTGVPPTTTPPTGTPPVTTPPEGVASETGVTNSTVNGASANQMFAKLDTSKKGYLTQADVASDQYLSTNFQRCDRNADSRLDRGEVVSCMQARPHSE